MKTIKSVFSVTFSIAEKEGGVFEQELNVLAIDHEEALKKSTEEVKKRHNGVVTLERFERGVDIDVE